MEPSCNKPVQVKCPRPNDGETCEGCEYQTGPLDKSEIVRNVHVSFAKLEAAERSRDRIRAIADSFEPMIGDCQSPSAEKIRGEIEAMPKQTHIQSFLRERALSDEVSNLQREVERLTDWLIKIDSALFGPAIQGTAKDPDRTLDQAKRAYRALLNEWQAEKGQGDTVPSLKKQLAQANDTIRRQREITIADRRTILDLLKVPDFLREKGALDPDNDTSDLALEVAVQFITSMMSNRLKCVFCGASGDAEWMAKHFHSCELHPLAGALHLLEEVRSSIADPSSASNQNPTVVAIASQIDEFIRLIRNTTSSEDQLSLSLKLAT